MIFYKYILINVLGWKINGEFPDIKKSVVIFAPHTSYWDGFYGKLFLMQFSINYKFLSKKELFKFPLNYFFRLYGSIPVSRNRKYIDEVVSLFEESNNLHIILSPEGQRAKTDHWKKGFYYIAKKANVPITVGYIDYKKKEIGIKGVIRNISSVKQTMTEICNIYKNVNAKYPKDFIIDERYS